MSQLPDDSIVSILYSREIGKRYTWKNKEMRDKLTERKELNIKEVGDLSCSCRICTRIICVGCIFTQHSRRRSWPEVLNCANCNEFVTHKGLRVDFLVPPRMRSRILEEAKIINSVIREQLRKRLLRSLRNRYHMIDIMYNEINKR
jgi:hypothetical protein